MMLSYNGENWLSNFKNYFSTFKKQTFTEMLNLLNLKNALKAIFLKPRKYTSFLRMETDPL